MQLGFIDDWTIIDWDKKQECLVLQTLVLIDCNMASFLEKDGVWIAALWQ